MSQCLSDSQSYILSDGASIYLKIERSTSYNSHNLQIDTSILMLVYQYVTYENNLLPNVLTYMSQMGMLD